MELTLDRFRSAHAESFEQAMAEIRSGRKESHWIWYVFPQIQGLGRSATAQYYEIQSREEALAFWADPVLSRHLVEASEAVLKWENPLRAHLHFPDDLKLRSSMTLFLLVSGEPVFQEVLNQFFDGSLDGYSVQKYRSWEKEREEEATSLWR